MPYTKKCVNNVNRQDPTICTESSLFIGLGQRQDARWTRCQFVAGTTQRNKQTILAHTYGLVRVTS